MATMMKSQNGAPTPFADNIAVAIDDDQRCFDLIIVSVSLPPLSHGGDDATAVARARQSALPRAKRIKSNNKNDE